MQSLAPYIVPLWSNTDSPQVAWTPLLLSTHTVKLFASIAGLCILSLSALRAQDQVAADTAATTDTPSIEMDSGSDASIAPEETLTPAELAPPTTPDEADSLEQSLYGQQEAQNEATAEPNAQSRNWKFNLHASAGSHYDDNIFISHTGQQSDVISRLTAGGGVTVGDYTDRQNNYFISDYTGIGDLFGRHSYDDAYEQNASAESKLLFGNLTVSGNILFQDLADEDIEIGTRTRRQLYTANGGARYDFSDKAYLEATAQVNVAHYDLYLGSNDERGGLSLNYLPDSNVTVGLGVVGGILNVQGSSSQTYEQILASLQLAATSKFTLKASAGLEDRQVTNDGSLLTPVLDIGCDYKPFEELDINLSAFRHVVNSAYYTDSDYVDTGVGAGVQYAMSARFTSLLSLGYTNSDYRGFTYGISRDDNYFFLRPALRYTASTYCYVELYYFYRNNASTVDTSSFNDTQTGMSVNLTY